MIGRETILYRGERIAVQLITEINTKIDDGMEYILRDEAGRYYLKRELHDGRTDRCRARRAPKRYHYRCHLHRISLNAVILFQVEFAAERILRLDTRKVLAAARKEAA